MSVLSDFKSLPSNEGLSASEASTLRLRIDDLLRFLGSPGDWGYGTKLGELTQILHAQRGALPATDSPGADT